MYAFLVAIGAGTGGVPRFALTRLTYRLVPRAMPFATLGVNLLGSLLIGILLFCCSRSGGLPPRCEFC
jgi:CrcB protein